MKTRLLAGAALAAVFTASGASAQAINGWYGALDLGWHRPEGIQTTSSNPAPDGEPYDWTFASEDSWAGFARLGYRMNSNWRIELEGGYRPGDIESVRGDGRRFPGAPIGLCTAGVTRTTASPTCGSPEGSIESWTLMANILYDFLPADAPFRPFVGFGVGLNRVDMAVTGQFSNVGTVTAANPQFQNLTINDEDLTFAYQGIAGVAWAMTERLAVDLTYRYLGGADLDFD